MNKSYVKVCWIVWTFLVTIFFVGKIFNLYLLKEILFIPYFFSIFVLLAIIDFINGIKFMNNIKLNYREKWEELTTTPFLGLKGANNIRELKFIFSSFNIEDNNLLELKESRKSSIKLVIVSFFSIPISAIILIILHMNKIITSWPF